MGTRGPKPVHIGNLHAWEFEWYKALHHLREGIQLPEPPWPARSADEERRLDAHIEKLKTLPLAQIVGEEAPPPNYQPTEPGQRAPLVIWEMWAEGIRQREIARFMTMKPRPIQALVERRDIFESLSMARTKPPLYRACERWEGLADAMDAGFGPYPAYVRAYPREFLAITTPKRYPRSPAAFKSRIDYLSRGMAGVLEGVSPLTGIGLLRNMNHGEGGRFWDSSSSLCGCWRCRHKRRYEELALERQQFTI